MMHRIALLPLALIAASAPAPAAAVEQPAAAPAAPTASIADLGWLVGRWEGTGIGGHRASETWSAPSAGQMVGHFAQQAENGPLFYELMTIVDTVRGPLFRLKHFDPDLRGWEGQGADDVTAFAFDRRDGDVWHFGALTIAREGPDAMTITVRMKSGDDLIFPMRRVR